MNFTISISGAEKLAGITAARNDYNATNANAAGFAPLATNQEYIQFVMDNAALSYVNQYK